MSEMHKDYVCLARLMVSSDAELREGHYMSCTSETVISVSWS